METEPLGPALDKAQKALRTALEQACGVDLSRVDTGELIRIEETLVSASRAAKEAVSLRLRRRSQRAVPGGAESARPEKPGDAVEEPSAITHRVFDDFRGTRWHAYAVRGSDATVERAGLPEAFRRGWLVFESRDEVRRVAPVPDRWEELGIEDLRQLCFRAAGVPRRITPRRDTGDTDPTAKS